MLPAIGLYLTPFKYDKRAVKIILFYTLLNPLKQGPARFLGLQHAAAQQQQGATQRYYFAHITARFPAQSLLVAAQLTEPAGDEPAAMPAADAAVPALLAVPVQQNDYLP